jgi:hypothetical protein
VEVGGLQQPAARRVHIARAAVRLEHGVAHAEHAHREPIVHGAAGILLGLALADADRVVLSGVSEAVEQVELGRIALLIVLVPGVVRAATRALARTACIDTRTATFDRLAEEDAVLPAMHAVASFAGRMSALALALHELANVVAEHAVGAAVALPRHVGDDDGVDGVRVVDHAALEADVGQRRGDVLRVGLQLGPRSALGGEVRLGRVRVVVFAGEVVGHGDVLTRTWARVVHRLPLAPMLLPVVAHVRRRDEDAMLLVVQIGGGDGRVQGEHGRFRW